METIVLWEAGLETALQGLSDSFRDEAMPMREFWSDERFARARQRADKLAHQQGGHNKFLESVVVCLRVKAPRAWWSEMDTYRVGTTKQSTSTMHTLAKRPPTGDDFDADTPLQVIHTFTDMWYIFKGDITALKMALPEGFLQTRTITTNYKVLQNIEAQRRGHRLKHWDKFLDELQDQLAHPNWVKRNG